MTDVDIQPMHISHLTEILEIEETVFTTPWTRRMFEHEIARGGGGEGPRSYAVVAVEGDRVVGYVIAWFLVDEVHLVNIAVRKAYQERGVGSFLLSHLIEKACVAGKIIITLEVRESNTSAQAFYRGFMFRKIGVRRGYYTDNREDAALMALDLSPIVERRKHDR